MMSSQFGGSSGTRKRSRDTSAYPTFVSRKRTKKATFKKLDKLKNRDSKAYGLFKYSGEGPFPQKLATTLLYRSAAVSATGGGAGTYAYSCALNNCMDFDVTNILGNKQPLYFDQLLSSTGPYQQWECKSWRTIVTVINIGAEALSVYWNGRGSAISSSEDDTLTEVTNRPYTQQRFLAPKGGTNDRAVFKTFGKWTDHSTDNLSNAAGYASQAPVVVYGNLFFQSPSSLTAPTFILQIDHYMDILCDKIDGTTS